jgi:hypothetical protein
MGNSGDAVRPADGRGYREEIGQPQANGITRIDGLILLQIVRLIPILAFST